MPIFFQQQINDTTRMGIWKIEETEDFFLGSVPLHRDVTHPHKRLQHLAGRYLLQFLFPAFPYELIKIADTRKPFLPDEQYHFSISHCGDYAAAIVSKRSRVGIDIEIPTEKVEKIKDKFLNAEEMTELATGNWPPVADAMTRETPNGNHQLVTVLWSAKEAVFKWYGNGGVDFSDHIRLQKKNNGEHTMDCFFEKTKTPLIIHYKLFNHLVLAWVVN